MDKKISFAGPWITQKEIDIVTDAVENGWYEDHMKYTKKLEKEISSYIGVQYALATHCCTHALHLAVASLGLKKGDEVIVPDHSWVATAYAIAYTGATCVFVDIEQDTLCIDPTAIEKAITPNTKAIMVVHNFGIPVEMDKILEIAEQHNLKIIEDAAPALGAEYKDKKIGSWGDVACFSFQGGKAVVSGEGGILVTNDEETYKRALLLATMGRTDRVAPFWSDEIGYQYTMPNLTASLALCQFERIDELIAKKREIHAWYYQLLANHPKVRFVKEKKDMRSTYCYPALFLSKQSITPRDEIIKNLRNKNIHCRPGFPRMSEFPVFHSERRFSNEVAEEFEKHGLVLPSAANLSRKDAETVVEILESFL